MNILIAEDDDISRDLLRRILEPEPDCSLTLAEDGEKAWSFINDPVHHFDVGIFDLMMPRLSGLGLVERIRGTPGYKDLPIILCTAVKDRSTVEKASALGIGHYVVKPYTRARILEKLQIVRLQVARRAPVENKQGVAARLGVDDATLAELVANLAAKVETWLAAAHQSRTPAEFRRDAAEAHALMGACLNLGARALHRELESVEATLIGDFAAQENVPAPSIGEVARTLAPIAAEVARLKSGPKPAPSPESLAAATPAKNAEPAAEVTAAA